MTLRSLRYIQVSARPCHSPLQYCCCSGMCPWLFPRRHGGATCNRYAFPFWAEIAHTLRTAHEAGLCPANVGKFSPPPNCPTNYPLAIRHHPLTTTTFALMSHSSVAPSESLSSNFQPILDNALKVYKKWTKKDLLAHPLASQLQACESPGDILAVLQQQIQGLDQSRSTDGRWTKWLDPTINILLTFSQTVGTVGLV